MYRAELSFIVLQYMGIWRPKFSSKFYLTLYKIFTCFIVLVTYFFTLTTILYLFRDNNNSLEEFTENFFYALALLCASIKIGNLFIKRHQIIELIDMLIDEKFNPQDAAEVKIQMKFDKFSRNGTIVFLALGGTTILLKAIGPLFQKNNEELPYKAWMPCEIEKRLSFWMIYGLQTIGSFGAGQTTIAIDTFAMTMMLQLCSQLEILMHRMKKYPYLYLETKIYGDIRQREKKIGMWVQHHQSMYIFGEKFNDIYWFVFLFQVLVTTMDVCTSSYLLATIKVTSDQFWTMIFSLLSILFQISIYCWHGSMVIEKSKEIGNAVYMSNWILLSNKSRTNLIQIIRRCSKPIIFNAGWFAPMSIDTFATILRLSYSVYSLLI